MWLYILCDYIFYVIYILCDIIAGVINDDDNV